MNLAIAPHEKDVRHGQILSGALTGVDFELSFSFTGSSTKAKGPSLLYDVPLTGGRIKGFISFPIVLAFYERNSASYRI